MMLATTVSLLLAGSVAAEPWVQERGGIPSACRKFLASQTTKDYTKITFFGGSITAGAGASKPERCYRVQTMAHLRKLYPGATLAENNSAIGGTGSWLGAFRTKTDALYGGAALVIVEFAVNDGGLPKEQVLASVEGIVRQIISRDASTDILFVYTLAKDQLDAYRAGRLPDTVAWHEEVARHYNLPSVNMGGYAAAKILAGELTMEQFAADGVHPTDRGYALYCEALHPYLAAQQAAAKAATAPPPRHTLVKPLGPAPMERAQCVPYEWAKVDPGWKLGQPSPVDRYLHVATCETPGAVLTLGFRGAQVGYADAIGPDTGDFEFSLDGGPWQPRPNFDPWCKDFVRAHARPLAMGLDPKQRHEVRLRLAERVPDGSKGRWARLGWLLVDGEVDDPCARPDALARVDAVWQTMDPLDYAPAPAPGRWRGLERTMTRLKDGPSLKIVMLGDSIIGDTSSSRYELLLGRLYPQCKVEKVVSVRGSTGCWWYKNDNQVEPYVLRHKPDLLMIGGISQREDVDSIRAVIQQVRAQQSPEILLMTPVFGAMRDPHIAKWTFDIPADPPDYRYRLRQLAEQERCGFLDLTGVWWRYIQQSGKVPGWFMRDAVHANERGFQILGRILERFFAPG
jgi:lysophospholipase L1-like esterase